MATQSVKVPVQLLLKQAQQQLQLLQKLLNGIKPDSKSYRELSSILKGITKQFGKISIEGKRSFTSSTQFQSFRKSLNELEIRVDSFQESFRKIDFLDLNIDTSGIDELKKKLSEIEEKRSSLVKGSIGKLLEKDDFKKVFNALEIDLEGKITFTGVIESIKEEVEKAEKELAVFREKQKEYKKIVGDRTKIDLNKEISSRYSEKTTISASKQKQLIKNLKSQSEIFKTFDFKFDEKGSSLDAFIRSMSAQLNEALANYQQVVSTNRVKIEEEKAKLNEALNLIGDANRWASGEEGEKQKTQLGEIIGQDLIKKYKTLPKVKEAIQATLSNLNVDESIISGEAQKIGQTWINSIISSFSVKGKKADQVANSLKTFFKNINLSFDTKQLVPLEGEDQADFVDRLVKHLKEKNGEVEKEYQEIIQIISEKESEISNLRSAQAQVEGSLKKNSRALSNFDSQEASAREEIEKFVSAARQQANSLIGNLVPAKNLKGIMGQLDAVTAKTSQSFESLQNATKKLENLKSIAMMWLSFNTIVNTSKQILKSARDEIIALDSVMTEIAMVTNMTQDQLWDQIGTYSDIARQYAASTKGVYEVSQLYYQQGLQTAEVMKLTTETLKLAKIASLDYSTATDYMTVAIRGFKLEMSEASHVTDVYAALAAATASDVEELAVAMSKTASSAEAVGASFESTAAMIATMVSVTREAPQNIGSAIKSIVSRYGEMTSDPSKIVDSEGEEMSLNRVDKALQSVGITLHDVNGQFRDFDDVILELSKKWDTLDANSQRYIATIMAGNRQMLAVA